MIDPKTWALAVLGAIVCAQTPALASDDKPTIVTVTPAVTPELTDKDKEEGTQETAAGSTTAPVTAVDAKADTDAGEKAKPANALPVPKLSKAEWERSVECLALNIYHEARSEPQQGQQAVAAVTINRVASPAFPNSICKVVKQGGKKRNQCQFSWWCDSHSDKPREGSAWQGALELSRKTLEGEIRDPTGGALYYHAKRVNPRWARTFKRTGMIGQHLFYRPQGA